MIVDVTHRPYAAVSMDAILLGAVEMAQPPVALLRMDQGVFALVEVPEFPAIVTQDFLTSNGEMLTSDGEALTW